MQVAGNRSCKLHITQVMSIKDHILCTLSVMEGSYYDRWVASCRKREKIENYNAGIINRWPSTQFGTDPTTVLNCMCCVGGNQKVVWPLQYVYHWLPCQICIPFPQNGKARMLDCQPNEHDKVCTANTLTQIGSTHRWVTKQGT